MPTILSVRQRPLSPMTVHLNQKYMTTIPNVAAVLSASTSAQGMSRLTAPTPPPESQAPE